VLPRKIETGMDSPRIKKIKEMAEYYKKMSEVYKAAAVTFEANMAAERRKREEKSMSVKMSLIVDESEEMENPAESNIQIESAQTKLKE